MDFWSNEYFHGVNMYNMDRKVADINEYDASTNSCIYLKKKNEEKLWFGTETLLSSAMLEV